MSLEYTTKPLSDIPTKEAELHDAALSEIVDYETWPEVIEIVLSELVSQPDWLLDSEIFSTDAIAVHTELLETLRSNHALESLSEIQAGELAETAFIFRFMEIFAEQFDAPYVYRGGDLDDLTNGVRGTFTFFMDESQTHVFTSHGTIRKDPCLFALPVAALIRYFKAKKGSERTILPEHGYDSIFDTSFDVLMFDYIPEDLMVYLPTT